MDQIRLNKLLNFYISTDQKKDFLTIYENFQFLLTYEDRKEYQKKIANYQQEGEEIKKIILKNFIDKPIKIIFKEIGLAIANEKKNKSKNEIWNIFLERKVYFEKEFQFKLPNKYGTFEIQYYSILNDLWFYFDPEYNNAKKIKLSELLKVFRLLGYVYEDLDKKTDQEAINIFNYLVNILYIYKDSGLIELSIFHLIIYSCLSFDKDSANNRLKHIKEKYNYINYTMYINEIEAIYYDKQITGEETIKILGSNKKSIEIKAEYINWRVNEFDSLFDSENFMLCFRFPYNSDINYIKMDETFSQGYDELFYKVIKSQVVKQAMMFDDEARKFKYLYSNEDILKEIKNNTYLVCLPFDNYYGFSDKNAFVVYLKSNFSFKEIKKTLATFDNLIRTQYHEYKHISRIYYHMVDDNLELKTPTFSLSQFKGDRNYINNFYQESLEIVKKKTANISENSKCFQKTFDEYGDLVEYAINGFKVEVQMIRSVLFCLDNSSWDMDPTIFNKNLRDNMRLDTSGFTLSNFAKGFGKTIYNYFDFVQKDDYTLNCTIFSTKSASSNGFNNEVIETTIFSHHMSRGNNDL